MIRNTQIGGYWGPEETDGGFPLQPGKQFEAVIIVQEECYKVSYSIVKLKISLYTASQYSAIMICEQSNIVLYWDAVY